MGSDCGGPNSRQKQGRAKRNYAKKLNLQNKSKVKKLKIMKANNRNMFKT